MKTLPTLWQRLTNPEGKTCARCSATHRELEHAIATLRQSLRPLGIEPTLETKEIDEKRFKANPSESNRIWISGKPLEEWLDASIGSSPCCSVCGTSECRTVEVDRSTFETTPERLVLQAALVAASHLLGPASDPPSPLPLSLCPTVPPYLSEQLFPVPPAPAAAAPGPSTGHSAFPAHSVHDGVYTTTCGYPRSSLSAK